MSTTPTSTQATERAACATAFTPQAIAAAINREPVEPVLDALWRLIDEYVSEQCAEIMEAAMWDSTADARPARGRLEAALAAFAVPGDLLKAARATVALTLREAIEADDAGQPKLYCRCDHLNPCWSLGDPTDAPVRRWGPDSGLGLACDECNLRAAIARATGARA